MTIGRVLVSFIAIFLWTVEAGASVFAQSVESFSAVAITPAGPVSNVLLAPDDFFVDFAGTVGGPGFVTVDFGSWKAIDGPGNDVIVHLFGDWDPPESFFVDAGDGATFERLGYSGIPDYSKGAIGFGFDLADVGVSEARLIRIVNEAGGFDHEGPDINAIELVNYAPIPEPSTILLLAGSLAFLGVQRRS